jgi:hypothetical protein
MKKIPCFFSVFSVKSVVKKTAIGKNGRVIALATSNDQRIKGSKDLRN